MRNSKKHVLQEKSLTILSKKSTEDELAAILTSHGNTGHDGTLSDKNASGSTPCHSSHQGLSSRKEYNTPLQPNRKSIKCLFCDCVTKRAGRRQIYVLFPRSEATVHAIKELAEKLIDTWLIMKLGNKENVAYHTVCFTILRYNSARIVTMM